MKVLWWDTQYKLEQIQKKNGINVCVVYWRQLTQFYTENSH